jgi:hypothetical protein
MLSPTSLNFELSRVCSTIFAFVSGSIVASRAACGYAGAADKVIAKRVKAHKVFFILNLRAGSWESSYLMLVQPRRVVKKNPKYCDTAATLSLDNSNAWLLISPSFDAIDK